jgi:hypothetical protein
MFYKEVLSLLYPLCCTVGSRGSTPPPDRKTPLSDQGVQTNSTDDNYGAPQQNREQRRPYQNRSVFVPTGTSNNFFRLYIQ